MKYIYVTILFCYLLFSSFNNQSKNGTQFIVAFVQDKHIDKSSEIENETDKPDSIMVNDVSTANYIGIFPKKNDTITIYKLKEDLKEKPEKFIFWSKKSNNQSITFYCLGQDDVKVTFANQNNIIVNNDIYTVNNKYYIFLKQKIVIEKSILDLAFFLKDGYGDYSQTLEPLNKNWRNQKENNIFKVIKAQIKNRNFQTDNQYFTYRINYKYNKNGTLLSTSGENSFNKNFVKQNNKHIIYTVNRSINERASDNEYLYKNKKTLFDSITGTRENFSNATTHYYTKYQSKLKSAIVDKKPKNIDEIFKILALNTKELR
jgi:hypothetical protein